MYLGLTQHWDLDDCRLLDHLRGRSSDVGHSALVSAVHEQQGEQQCDAGGQERSAVCAKMPLHLHQQ